jgi:putative flippase GtrA
MTTATAPELAAAPSLSRTPQVEIVVPVYNEEGALPRSIRRLHAYLLAHFPFSWRITIADNASTDGTMSVARQLAWELPGVNVVHLDQKGRGRALRAAWSGSDAQVACYMDVDLSTDLRGLLPLVAPLMSGHSDLAIGTRLSKSSQVTRGPKREFISRTYNRILRATVRARFSDAQCGFKAGRADVLRDLLPQVRDDAWFFDTELLVLAQRSGLRIHEVPVDWVDDPDSRVDIVPTAVADLRGVARLVAASQPARFIGIGIVSTLAFAVIYLGLRELMTAQLANALGLAITAVGNTAANRRFTFGVRGRARLLRDHAFGLAIWAGTVAITGVALLLLDAAVAHPRRALELAVLVGASATATVTRYLALRFWVFARRGRAVASS